MDKLSAILTAPAPGRGFQAKIAKSWTNNIHEIGPNSANETRKEFSLCLVTFGMVMREQAWAPELRLPAASLAPFPHGQTQNLLFCFFVPFTPLAWHLCAKKYYGSTHILPKEWHAILIGGWICNLLAKNMIKRKYIRSIVHTVAHGARNSEKYE